MVCQRGSRSPDGTALFRVRLSGTRDVPEPAGRTVRGPKRRALRGTSVPRHDRVPAHG
ncbi:hypothetical protein GCM10027075_13860 [Streptomyces heilongjiangensis]